MKLETISFDEIKNLPLFPPEKAEDFVKGKRFLFTFDIDFLKAVIIFRKDKRCLVADIVGETKMSRTVRFKVIKVSGLPDVGAKE